MFAHIFRYRLTCLLRDREMIFWTLMFPLVLSFFFNLAFGNLDKTELFHPLPVAMADDAAWQADIAFRQTLETLSQGEDRLFDLTVADPGSAEQLLQNGEVIGVMFAGSPVRLVVLQTGMGQNILMRFLEDYNRTAITATSLIQANPANTPAILAALSERVSFIREASATTAPTDRRLIYFYGLLAMACFYGGFFGSREVTDIQADISARAARINVAPVHKGRTFLSSAAASLLVQFVEMLLLVLFLRFVLGIGFAGKMGYILLTVGIGSLAGVSFGACLSALVKKSEGIKTALLICLTMLGTFLAGMMYADVKYAVMQHAPAAGWLNPVNLLSDAFYSLYYYDTTTRFFQNLGGLLVLTFLFCTIVWLVVRKRKYASL